MEVIELIQKMKVSRNWLQIIIISCHIILMRIELPFNKIPMYNYLDGEKKSLQGKLTWK